MNFRKNADGVDLLALDVPEQPDKRPVFVCSPGTEGTYTWVTCKGDDLNPTPPASGRGDGVQAKLVFSEADSDDVRLQFIEPVEIFSGFVYWKPVANWDFEDLWSLSIELPATEVTENQSQEGNCNLVEVAPGSEMYIIIPAAGDGTHDVDLEQAVPTPDGYNEKAKFANPGYWDVDQYWSEEITPNADGKGGFNLYTFANEFFFIKPIDCGSPTGQWTFPGHKAEWISKKWTVRFHVDRATSGSGKIGGHFHLFRPGAT